MLLPVRLCLPLLLLLLAAPPTNPCERLEGPPMATLLASGCGLLLPLPSAAGPVPSKSPPSACSDNTLDTDGSNRCTCPCCCPIDMPPCLDPPAAATPAGCDVTPAASAVAAAAAAAALAAAAAVAAAELAAVGAMGLRRLKRAPMRLSALLLPPVLLPLLWCPPMYWACSSSS